MKVTFEMPDSVFQRAEVSATKLGIPLRQFVTEAVEEKLRANTGAGDKPWVPLTAQLRRLRKETAKINKIIESEFGRINPEEWT